MVRNTAPSRSSREKHFWDKTAGIAAVKLKDNAFAVY